MRRLLNNIVWFVRGVVCIRKAKRFQTFNKVFKDFGEMYCRAISIDSCKGWQKILPHYLFWDNVKVIISDKWKDDEDFQVAADLYRMMTEKSDCIGKAIRVELPDSEKLKNHDEVQMEIHLYDFDGKTRHPYVCLSYQTESNLRYITIFVEYDGDVLVCIN